MLNKALAKQTLVAIVLASAPALADPPSAHVPAVHSFKDWRLGCATDPCGIYTAVAGADGSEVLRLAVGTGKAPVLAVTTALPLFLPDGIALGFGARPERVVPWRTCGAGGCEATLPIDPELAESLRRERSGTATFTLVDGVPVRLGFSLLGYQAAVRARDAVRP